MAIAGLKARCDANLERLWCRLRELAAPLPSLLSVQLKFLASQAIQKAVPQSLPRC